MEGNLEETMHKAQSAMQDATAASLKDGYLASAAKVSLSPLKAASSTVRTFLLNV